MISQIHNGCESDHGLSQATEVRHVSAAPDRRICGNITRRAFAPRCRKFRIASPKTGEEFGERLCVVSRDGEEVCNCQQSW